MLASALLLLSLPSHAAVTDADRTTIRQWLFGEARPCGAVKVLTERELGYTCPAVPWNLPAALCANQLANNCMPPEPACSPTAAGDLGPNYLEGAPARDDLRDLADAGTTLVVSGQVLGTDCAPIAGATLDVWQADPYGDYDFSAEYDYRGVITTDAAGNYRFTTYLPGAYFTGRGPLPAHIHLIVSGGGVSLTTQLLFVGDPSLTGGEDPSVLATLVDDGAGGYTATWDVVLGE